MYSTNGQTVKEYKTQTNGNLNESIEVTDIKAGMYYLEIETNGKIESKINFVKR